MTAQAAIAQFLLPILLGLSGYFIHDKLSQISNDMKEVTHQLGQMQMDYGELRSNQAVLRTEFSYLKSQVERCQQKHQPVSVP